MDNFIFCNPTKIVFGRDMELEVGKLIKEYGGTNVLIHYGGGSAIKSGLIDRVKDSLNLNFIKHVELGGVKPNPRASLVYEGIKICKEKNIDFILAVGGGSTIDSAKAIGMGACYDGDFWDIYVGKHSPDKTLKVATILTIAAAGSESSGSSVITNEEFGLKRGFTSDLIRPVFSILNPQLTTTLPLYQTACGATDIIAHVFERYFTNTKEVETSDRLCEAVILSMINNMPKVMSDPTNYEYRANLMWAGTIAHNDLIGMGRSQDWNSHGLEHELSALYDVAHGAGLAVVMPHWMKYTIDHDPERFQQMAVRIFGVKKTSNPKADGLKGIKKFQEFLSQIGMPLTFKEIGAKKKDIEYMINKLGVVGKSRDGFMKLTEDDCRNIYLSCLKK